MIVATMVIVGAVLLASLPLAWLHLGANASGMMVLYASLSIAILALGHTTSLLLAPSSPLMQLLAATILRVALVLTLVIYAWKTNSPYAQPEHVLYIGAFYFAILGVEVHQAMQQFDPAIAPDNAVPQAEIVPDLNSMS